MDNNIKQALDNLVKNEEISKEQLFDFGKSISSILITKSDEDFNNDLKGVYDALLRKGHHTFNAFDSTYDTFFRHHIVEGLQQGLKDQAMNQDLIFSYASKAFKAMPQYTNGDDLIVQRIAVTFADEKALDENLPKLTTELSRFTRNSQPQFWNKVYDEFKLRGRLDLIPKIAEDIISDFMSPNVKKAVLQGLSNLGNENPDNLNFNQLMQDFIKNEQKDEVVLLIDEYYKSPDNSKLEKLGIDLAKVITKHPIEEQTDLWSKARDNFEKQSFDKSMLEKQMAITQGAITEINSNEERDALVNGLSGFSRFFSNKLGKMRINDSSSIFMIPPKNRN